jgi:hypothetical protein
MESLRRPKIVTRVFLSALRSCQIRALAGTAAMISPQTPAGSGASPINTWPFVPRARSESS